MAKLSILAGATSQTVNVFIQNSSSTTGAGLTGLVFNTSGLTAYYVLPRAASAAITLATLAAATSVWSTGGFKEIDATNAPGLYRLDIPNAALAAASGRFVTLYLQGATNMAPCLLEIELTGWDNQDAVHGGLSALPNTACTTNASLLTSGTGTDQISNTSGRVDIGKALGTAVTLDANNALNVSTKYVGGTLQTARDIGASVLLSAGTGTGQLDFTTGVVKSNMMTIVGQTCTALSSVGFPSLLASPTNITGGTITNVTNLTNAPTAGDFTATMKTSLNAATPALSAAGVQAIWDALTSALTTVGSIGKLLVTNLDAAISSRTKPADTQAAVTLCSTLTTYTGNTPQTGDAYARLGAPVGASISADVAGQPAALLDLAAGIETGWTLRQGLRVMLSSMAAKLSGAATTTVSIRDVGDTKDRIVATVDSNGNRSAITYDKT